mgnify:CR=1 FL=1
MKNEKDTVVNELPKKGSAKKVQKKDDFFKKVINFIIKHKTVFSIVSAIILIIIFTLLFLKSSLQFTVLTIGEDNLRTNKLYDKVFTSLYAKGKRNYLTNSEISKETNNYNNEYYKVNQIVLGIVDNSTLQSLSNTVINQKLTLIETIYKEAKSGVNFEDLVNKYSEEASEDNNLYFTKDDVLDEVYNVVDSLDTDEISDVIKTKNAYSIIKRLPLDDKKLDEYLETKAKEYSIFNG